MRTRSNGRGEAAQLGIAIVLVLALTSALAITSIGSVTLDESRSVAETQSGLQTMTELDSRASLVALGGGESESLDVTSQSNDGRVTVENGGEIRFVMRNTTDNSTIWQENVSLGAVTYKNGNERIAYQGGGVWRRTTGSNGSVMVSPPELHYQDGTLTLPMINVSGANRRISKARVRKVGEKRIYPNVSRGVNGTNPVREGNELVLFVKSEYYQGWATFFRERVGGDVIVYDNNQTVRVDLVSPQSQLKVDSGLISTGTGSGIEMKGGGGAPNFVDSYNSSAGDYESSKGGNGTIRSPGGVKLGGNSYIEGTVNTGGTLEFSGSGNNNNRNNTIYGDAYHQKISNNQSGTITGVSEENGTGVEIKPIDGTVTTRVNNICANGSSLPEPSTTIDASGSSRYCYSGDLTIEKGEVLKINVSKGDVNIAIDGDLRLKNGNPAGRIKVVGDTDNNTARVWLGGDEVTIDNDAGVFVPEEKSPAFRLFGPSATSVSMGGNSTFVGLLYAPAGGSGGSFSMQAEAELYGSAVVGEVKMNSGSAVHYDQALGGFTFARTETAASRLSYLYVTIHEVEIEDR